MQSCVSQKDFLQGSEWHKYQCIGCGNMMGLSAPPVCKQGGQMQ